MTTARARFQRGHRAPTSSAFARRQAEARAVSRARVISVRLRTSPMHEARELNPRRVSSVTCCVRHPRRRYSAPATCCLTPTWTRFGSTPSRSRTGVRRDDHPTAAAGAPVTLYGTATHCEKDGLEPAFNDDGARTRWGGSSAATSSAKRTSLRNDRRNFHGLGLGAAWCLTQVARRPMTRRYATLPRRRTGGAEVPPTASESRLLRQAEASAAEWGAPRRTLNS